MRHSKIIVLILCLYLSPSCDEVNLCEIRPKDPLCELRIRNGQLGPFNKRYGADFYLHSVAGPRECIPFNISLTQGNLTRDGDIRASCAYLDDERGRSVLVSIPSTLSGSYRIGPASLQLRAREDQALLQEPILIWVLPIRHYTSWAPPLKFTATSSQIPRAEQLGMQDGILYVASSGYSGSTKYWTVDKYRYQPSPGAVSKLSMDYLRSPLNLPSDRLLLSVVEGKAEGSAFLSHKPEDSSLALTLCPVRESTLKNTDCQSDTQMSLPTGTQAMVVSGNRSRIVRAAANGELFWAPLSPPVAPGGWTPIGTTGAGVRLAMTDLNADGESDIVAVWGLSGYSWAAAYLATDTGYVLDPTVSMQLSQMIWAQPITALAAGDVDRDGYGDVVFAQKQKLVVLQSQLDKFEAVWSTTVDPEAGKTQIDAIALGRLESGTADDKQLDIVTASNSAYDGMNNLTMYLHAFRPMP